MSALINEGQTRILSELSSADQKIPMISIIWFQNLNLLKVQVSYTKKEDCFEDADRLSLLIDCWYTDGSLCEGYTVAGTFRSHNNFLTAYPISNLDVRAMYNICSRARL